MPGYPVRNEANGRQLISADELGNGDAERIRERLVIDAKKAGIRVVDRRGPLGTPPATQNA